MVDIIIKLLGILFAAVFSGSLLYNTITNIKTYKQVQEVHSQVDFIMELEEEEYNLLKEECERLNNRE